jgi:hypothetical protein
MRNSSIAKKCAGRLLKKSAGCRDGKGRGETGKKTMEDKNIIKYNRKKRREGNGENGVNKKRKEFQHQGKK